MTKASLPKDDETQCDPNEVALKSFFLGPQAENASWVIQLLHAVFDRWVSWRRSLFPSDGSAISLADQNSRSFIERREKFENITQELLTRFEQEVPKFSPRYVGHMFSEVSLPALFGHVTTLLHNPNNISGESSRVGTQIENEAIEELLAMVGYSVQNGTGHFTSGGTIANLEALLRAQSRMAHWLASEAALCAHSMSHSFDPVLAAQAGWLRFDEVTQKIKETSLLQSEISKWKMGFVHPKTLSDQMESISKEEFLGPVMLVPENKHYSWTKGCRILGLGTDALWLIELDEQGKLSNDHLKRLLNRAMLKRRPVLMVVSVVGTTELGGIDPVHEVQETLDDWKKEKGIHIWHHVDAAYGGYLRTLDLRNSRSLSTQNKNALAALSRADSITLDPHKLGYVPYASGAFLTREKRDYYFRTFDDAPYIDFDETVDRGPYTIEGSRGATGAVATWMTAKTMGLNPEGYGLLLERTIRICRDLGLKLTQHGLPVRIAPGCDTNILCFTCAKTGEEISKCNLRTLKVFERFSPKQNDGAFIVSKTTLNWKSHSTYLDRWTRSWNAKRDTDEIVLIRMTMMNPFFSSKEMKANYADDYIRELKSVLRKI